MENTNKLRNTQKVYKLNKLCATEEYYAECGFRKASQILLKLDLV